MSQSKIYFGQAALPTILLICGIITEIAIAGALVAFVVSSSGFGERLSAQALAAAKAGIEDAFIKVTVNKNYFSSPEGYIFSVAGREVNVIVNKDTPIIGTDEIISTAKAFSRQRKIKGILIIDSNTGKVDLESIKEIE
jgi:hypothetical protein